MMYLTRLTLCVVAALMLAHTCAAQNTLDEMKVLPVDYEQGDISHIKDKRRVYISAVNLPRRERIFEEVKKHKDDLQIVARPEQADFVLAYATEIDFDLIRKKPLSEWKFFTHLVIYIRQSKARPLIVWRRDKRYTDIGETQRPLEVDAVRAFIKDLKSIRGAK